jgi:hypothetical protein
MNIAWKRRRSDRHLMILNSYQLTLWIPVTSMYHPIKYSTNMHTENARLFPLTALTSLSLMRKCVLFAVRTEFLNYTLIKFGFKGLKCMSHWMYAVCSNDAAVLEQNWLACISGSTVHTSCVCVCLSARFIKNIATFSLPKSCNISSLDTIYLLVGYNSTVMHQKTSYNNRHILVYVRIKTFSSE